MKELKLGVAGLGHGATLLQANTAAGSHLRLRVTAVCDTDRERAPAAAERYGVPFVTSDFAELAAHPELDVIGIYTPGPLHAPQILAALDAGKHVMVTKSMVYTMAEVEQVVAAVERTGRVLLVSQ
ncbi:MAG: Gfo/Idh/MocA family oxidoreductase, partial [Spirochaetaceae bacterium]|nr:Gfo/Idh/MocA family oxidoreductase [Spirochaetaceae bacterium]